MKPISAAVLAGGASVRMGTDKSRLRIAGETLLVRTARALAAVSGDVMISCGQASEFDAAARALGGRLVRDRWPGAGPLAGIEACLTAARHEFLLVVAVDMPFLSVAVLAQLVERAIGAQRAVVARSERGLEPLLAVYPRHAAQIADALLHRGERRMGAFMEAVGYESLEPGEWRSLDPTGVSFLNLNVPSDVAVAATLATGGEMTGGEMT